MIKNPHRTQAFADWISVQAHRVAGMLSLNSPERERRWHHLMSLLPNLQDYSKKATPGYDSQANRVLPMPCELAKG